MFDSKINLWYMDYMHQIKTEIFNATIEVRTGFGLQSVIYSNSLDRMAQIHTNEMYTHKFFLHENPYCKKVQTLVDRIDYCGLIGQYESVGENLADYPAVNDIIFLNPISPLIELLNPRKLIPAKQLSRSIIKGWYNSPGHRANLLRPEYDSVGFGLLLYPKMCYSVKLQYLLVTQNFAKIR